MPYRSPRVASAIRQTISTSDFRCGLAGSSGPGRRAPSRSSPPPRSIAGHWPGCPSRCGPWSAGSARSAADQVRAVELGRDVHGHPGPAHRLHGDVGVRRGLHEVAAETDEDVGLAVPQRADRIDGVQAVLAGRVEAELLLQCVEEVLAAAAPRCPSCGRPARWSGRGPGTARRRACRCCPARRPGCRPP